MAWPFGHLSHYWYDTATRGSGSIGRVLSLLVRFTHPSHTEREEELPSRGSGPRNRPEAFLSRLMNNTMCLWRHLYVMEW